LIAIGNGLKIMVTQQFEDFGANNIFIASGDIFGEGGFGGEDSIASAISSQNLKYSDVGDISRLREHISRVTPLSLNSSSISYKENTKSTSIAGVSADYSIVTNTNTKVGRFFTDQESDRKERVTVLGFALAEELFGAIDPVNKSVIINNRGFKVIGVAEEKGGGFGGPNFDTYAYIPIQSWFQLFDSQIIFRIIAQSKSQDGLSESMNAIENLLGKRLDDEDFSVFEQADILGIIDQILGAITAGLGGIAAISLVVGGIGIMNIMLVSVTERTREIGLRKALGATPKVILIQFLIESVLLSVIGGMIGVGIAYAISALIQQFIPAAVSFDSVLLAFGVSAAVGVIFGVLPARKASQLSPIEALRYE
ncbi:MAG: ABC transporter permease, partial [Candidatus Heimdallarchaeota archaeon]|nr:ABC transporter permease [Candidatus Heimdallarchaeota archaeon]